MGKREKIFFIVWGIILFPLLALYLKIHFNLNDTAFGEILTYMTAMKFIFASAVGFSDWNRSP